MVTGEWSRRRIGGTRGELEETLRQAQEDNIMLRAELAELRKDRARLEWILEHPYRAVCLLSHEDVDRKRLDEAMTAPPEEE